MTPLERLIRTSSIWFLPDVGRSGAVHYLQGRDVGNFIVRQSSKPGVLALSVRLPAERGTYVEHYLVEAAGDGGQRLEGSDNVFPSLPALVCHYCRCCDELPVQLKLPDILSRAATRHELSSLSLLGRELWVSSMPRSRDGSTSPATSSTSPPPRRTAADGDADLRPCSATEPTPFPAATPERFANGVPHVPAARPATLLVRPVPLPRVLHPPPATAPARPIPAVEGAATTPVLGRTPDRSDEPPGRTPVEGDDVRRRRSSAAESSPDACYCSSLADKISDYEDVWGASSESPGRLSTFKPRDGRRKSERKKRVRTETAQNLVCRATQTENPGRTPPGASPRGVVARGLSRSLPGVCGDGFASEDRLGPLKPGGQLSSPFYAEPVDSILARGASDAESETRGPPHGTVGQRHSEPNVRSAATVDAASDPDEAASRDADRAAALSTPVENGGRRGRGERSWSVDASWTWMGSDDEDGDEVRLEPRFPVEDAADSEAGEGNEDAVTVEELIAISNPDLRVPHVRPLTEGNVLRASRYDNLHVDATSRGTASTGGGEEEDAATEFCEPWDSLRWERLLGLAEPDAEVPAEHARSRGGDAARSEVEDTRMSSDSTDGESAVGDDASAEVPAASEFPTVTATQARFKGFRECLKVLLASKRVAALRNKESVVGVNIRRYIFRLVEERNTTFAMTIENFIQCTRESSETSPAVVMRNIRQFMSGMKNYLLKHGEGQFEQLVQEERSKLKPNEFVNIDAVIEEALHRLVIRPLKQYLYQLFVNHYTETGSLKLLSDNIKYARTKTPEDLGIGKDYRPPQGISLEVVKYFLTKLQESYSPLKKLENLLAAISTIYNSVQKNRGSRDLEPVSLGADDFLPIFIYVLVQCGLISAEVEAEYMWGLLHPSLLTGEGGYYLTTLSSAVHVLKNLGGPAPSAVLPPPSSNVAPPASAPETFATNGDCKWYRGTVPVRYPSIADLQGFMQIVIPDDVSGSVVAKTLPVRPNMTTKEVCKMIAHKFQVTNPQDYGLFKLVDGEETQLGDNESPQTIKADLITSGTDCRFAYKRCDMKFVWPRSEKS